MNGLAVSEKKGFLKKLKDKWEATFPENPTLPNGMIIVGKGANRRATWPDNTTMLNAAKENGIDYSEYFKIADDYINKNKPKK